MHHKLREWKVGEAVFRVNLSQDQIRQLELEVWNSVKGTLPESTLLCNITVSVSLDCIDDGKASPFTVVHKYEFNTKVEMNELEELLEAQDKATRPEVKEESPQK